MNDMVVDADAVLGCRSHAVAFSVLDLEVLWRDVLFRLTEEPRWPGLIQSFLETYRTATLLPAETAVSMSTQVKRLEVDFRKARRLSTADDYVGWLRTWEIPVPEFRREFLRSLCLPSAGTALLGHSSRGSYPVALRAHLLASGLLFSMRDAMATDAALAAPTVMPPDWVEIQERAVVVRSLQTDDSALSLATTSHSLNWTRLEYDAVNCSSNDVALEVLASVRHDHADLEGIAIEAGLEFTECSELIEDIEGAISARLSSAAPGDLLGPITTDRGTYVLQVRDRVPPVLADPRIRHRAQDFVAHQLELGAMSSKVVFADD